MKHFVRNRLHQFQTRNSLRFLSHSIDTTSFHEKYSEQVKQFEQIVHQRHACRYFIPNQSIPQPILKHILQMTQRTPSGYNLQPYVMIVVNDETKKKELFKASLFQKQVLESSCTVIFACNHKALEENEPLMRKISVETGYYTEGYSKIAQQYSNLLLQTGSCYTLQLAKFLVTTAISYFRPMMVVPINVKAYLWKQTSLAIQTFMLACSSYGLATCPMEGIDERRVKQVVNLPEHFSVPCIVTVGYEDIQRYNGKIIQSPRLPFDKQIFENDYKTTFKE